MSKSVLGILFLIIGIFTVFYSGLFTYFVQDDFYYFQIISGVNLKNIYSILIPLKTAVWYRPLSVQFFFLIGKYLYGLNPFPYHIVVYLTHVGTTFMIFKILKWKYNSVLTAFLGAIFYGFHQIHTVALSWLATYSFVMGPFLLSCAIYCYFNKKQLSILIFFILAVLASEISLVFPVSIYIADRLTGRRSLVLYPYILVWIGSYLMRFVIYPTAVQTSLYKFSISSEMLSLIKFYILRLIGIPLLFDTLPLVLKISTILFSIPVLFSIIRGIVIYLKVKKDIPSDPLFIFSLLLGFAGMIPFLLLPNHIAPYYLSFSLLGFSICGAFLITRVLNLFQGIKKVISVLLLVSSFSLLQFIGSRWTYQTHWIYRRAQLAKELIQKNELIQSPGTEGYFALGAEAIYFFK